LPAISTLVQLLSLYTDPESYKAQRHRQMSLFYVTVSKVFSCEVLSYRQLCFRLYPSATMNCRILSEDIVLDGYLIPKEVKILLYSNNNNNYNSITETA